MTVDDNNITSSDHHQQLQNLSLALQQKEVESKGLKHALRVLQAANKKKTSLYPDLEAELAETREELSRTQRQLEQQTEQSVRLQCQVLRQQQEMRSLKERHQECIQQMVALEIDSETHDIHFTEYSEQQRRLEQVAMKEVFSDENDASRNDLSQKRRAQDFIAKLMADYTQLEERYKRDAAEHAQWIQILEQKNQTLKASVNILEDRVASTNKSVKFSLNIDSSKTSSSFSNVYRQRINDLETNNAKLLLQYNEMKRRLDDVGTKHPSTTQRATPLDFTDNKKGENQTVPRLQHQLAVCKDQMALLRTKAIAYQVRTFEGAADPGQSTKEWPTKFRGSGDSSEGNTWSVAGSSSDDDDDDMSSQGSTGDATRIRDLKDILKRKDRELGEQRQKSRAREKELLAQLQDVYETSNHPTTPEHVRFFL